MGSVAVVDMYKNLCLWGRFTLKGMTECPVCAKPMLVYEHDDGEYYGTHVGGENFFGPHFIALKDETEYHPLIFETSLDVRLTLRPLFQSLQELRDADFKLTQEQQRVREMRDQVSDEVKRMHAEIDKFYALIKV